MKRPLVIGAIVAVLVVAGLLVYRLAVSLDAIVARVIEEVGSETLGVPVRVGSVELALTEGKGTIRGLRVANPKGYSSGDAFRLGEITLQVEPGSVTSSPIVVSQLRVLAPEVRAELDARGKSNVQTLLDQVDSGGAAPAGEGEPVRIAIRRFTFEQGRLVGDATAVGGEGDRFEADLPAVRLNDIGGSRGATPDEIATTVVKAFLRATTRAVAAWQAGRQVEKHVGGELGKEAGRALRNLLD